MVKWRPVSVVILCEVFLLEALEGPGVDYNDKSTIVARITFNITVKINEKQSTIELSTTLKCVSFQIELNLILEGIV